MPRLASLLGMLAAAAVLVGGLGRATSAAEGGSDALFAIHRISVDVTATTAAAARRQALEKVQERAYRALIEKLVAADDMAAMPPPDPELIESLVRAVDILEERSSSTRYLATVNVSFRADAVRQLFTRIGVAYTESMAGPYLLVPVFVDAGARRVFGDHPWRRALLAADWEDRLIRYRLPEDTPRARSLLTPQWLEKVRPGELAPVAETFGVRQVVLAEADTGFDVATGRLAVRYRVRLGPVDEVDEAGHVIAREGEDREAVLLRAADAVLDAIDTRWKARTLIAGSELRRITVRLPVRGLDEWLAVRRRLAQVSLVRKVDPLMIGLPVSRLELRFAGTIEQFRLALAQVGLRLEGDGEGALLRPVEQVTSRPDESPGAGGTR